MRKHLYDNYVETLHRKFESRLNDIKAHYNFDLGDEFEVAICEVLREFLPLKYGICRGFVVNSQGEKEGDDIIIYDQERFPTLNLNKRDKYERKENIPIEAVYAYIEAKHTLHLDNNPDLSLMKAIKQVSKVKQLCSSREKVYASLGRVDIPFDETMLFHVASIEGFPKYTNPLLTVILGRNISFEVNNDEDLSAELSKKINTLNLDLKNPFKSDMIVFGDSCVLSPFDVEKKLFMPFMIEDRKCSYYSTYKEKYAFGIFLIELFHGLDWISLGKMPWLDMLYDSKKP